MSSNKKLIAGPWVGEFGYLLFTWQARLRWLAQNEYDEVVVICRPGQEYFFEDFASELIIWDKPLPDSAVGCGCPPVHLAFRDTYSEKGSDRALPGKAIVNYNWRDRIQSDPRFSQQKFIEFGRKNSGIETYDILFHVRSTKKRGQGYKNTFNKWDNLLKGLPELKVACIGTKHQSQHIPGTTDKRDVPIDTLADIMQDSRVIVGASSGPIHLAALCGLPQVTWVGRKLINVRGSALRRYTHHWNPFDVAVRPMYRRNWNPRSRIVLQRINELLEGGSK